MELTDEKRTRIAALLEAAGGTYSTLSAVYFGAADSARKTSDPRLLRQLEEMAETFAKVAA